jgi:hypothetical protein
LYTHLEAFITDPKINLKGIDPITKEKYPAWIQNAAIKAIVKLNKYYPTSDANIYVLGTGILENYLEFECIIAL